MNRLHRLVAQLPVIMLPLFAAGLAAAAERESADYSIVAETTDGGGRRTTSASYTQDGSAGTFAGTGFATAPIGHAKLGYVGQLFEIAGLVVNASPASVSEGGSRQLDPSCLLDDETLLAIAPTLVDWAVIAGPIASLSPGGLATGGPVFQNTPATVRGSFGAFTASFNLTVLDSIADNFGDYAGDEIGDAWQVQYFGPPPNPVAGPLHDADGDGQENRFEFLAGVNPTDPNSVFATRIEQSTSGTRLIFSPALGDRTYSVTYHENPFAPLPWPPLPAGTPTYQNGAERTVLDSIVPGAPRRFYRVEISP